MIGLAILVSLLPFSALPAFAQQPQQQAQQPFVSGIQTMTGGGRSYPTPMYFAAFNALNDGDYKAAEAQFRTQLLGGYKTLQTRWIDSICTYTMVGESQYRLGNYTTALENFTAALQLFSQYSDWMLRVQFPETIPAGGGGRGAPWGKSTRGSRPGRIPEMTPIAVGDTPDNVLNKLRTGGGPMMPQQLIPVQTQEIVRCTVLAMQRRHELLGPLVAYDSLTDELVGKTSKRQGRPNHWSEAWIDVEQGMAYSAAGKTGQAIPLLHRSLLAQGQYDHPLTGYALIELGRIALSSGDFKNAANYFEEATYTAYDYGDATVLEDAFRNLFLAHVMAGDADKLDVAITAAATWSKNRLRELNASLLLIGAESLAIRGQTAQAAGLLTEATAAVGRHIMGQCEIGSRLNWLTALTQYQKAEAASGDKGQTTVSAGDTALMAALAWQKEGAKRLFQIALADKLCETNSEGRFGPRAALALYEQLLRDPTPTDWMLRPLESLAVMATPHLAPFEHWFATVVQQDPAAASELAIEVADLNRRHRFLTALPLGGRLTSLRWVLEAPTDSLTDQARLQRQDLLTRYPKYAEGAEKIRQLRAELTANGVKLDTPEAQCALSPKLTELGNLAAQQETILHEIAVRREPADILFPPIRKMKTIQKSLGPGQLLLAFFSTSRSTYGWLFSADRYAMWKVENPALLEKRVIALLRSLGNFDATRELQEAQLTDESWRQSAREVVDALLKNSKINFNGEMAELTIVPDGVLWYLPFEMLPVGGDAKEYRPMISRTRVRYAPMVSLSMPLREGRKPSAEIGVALGKLFPSDNADAVESSWQQMQHVADHVLPLRNPLPAPSPTVASLLDGLIVLDEIQPAATPMDWSPIPLDRVKGMGTLAAWLSLPWKGVDAVVLPGFHSAAENSLKAAGTSPGSEMFMATTGLLATGARTVLISRWRTGGHTAIELVRQFVQELPFSTADEAWQRAVQLITISPLDPTREPRVRRKQDADQLKAEHPFFWAGYMLVDTGASPQKADNPEEKPILKFVDKKKSDAKPGDAKQPDGLRANDKNADEKKADDKKTDELKPPANAAEEPPPKPIPIAPGAGGGDANAAK